MLDRCTSLLPLVVLGVVLAPAQPDGEMDDSAELARDLVTAMLVHDASIRTLSWRQTLRLEAGTPRELPFVTDQALDERGRWSCRYVRKLLNPEGGDPIELRGRMVFDGHEVRGYEDTRASGTIRDYAGERVGEVAVDCWLGRHVYGDAEERLGELLLRSKDLAFRGMSPGGLPIVGGTAVLKHVVAEVEVEIDPDHGFAPRNITVRDRAIRVPYWQYTTTEYVCIDGIWLPRAGRHVSRKFNPTDEEWQRFVGALRSRGLSRLSDVLDPAVQAAYLDAIREAFGATEVRSEPLVPDMVVEADFRRVNAPLDDAEFILEFPLDYAILDSFRDLIKPAGTRDWLPNARRIEADEAPEPDR